jgi:L-alanine-DL-glutamate epimerase-like enolase superfamily enzyme
MARTIPPRQHGTVDSGTGLCRPYTETGGVPVTKLMVEAYTIPTDAPESDGTLEWHATTLVVVQVVAGDTLGLGYVYGDAMTADVIAREMTPIVVGQDAMATAALHAAMRRAVRNVGGSGIASTAIAAVDIALWDLKARLLNVPLVTLLGAARDAVPVYGSGGFTSYSIDRLQQQLADWTREGLGAVKMKVGRDAVADVERVAAARQAIGDGPQLFVDANGAYSRKQALHQADLFATHRVEWFEEPVSSDDREGLRLIRDRAPAGMDIAAGEYAYVPGDFLTLLTAGAVDVLQADATRCGGVTGFLEAGALCDAWNLPLSAHTAPGIHAHLGCAVPRVRHIEYFYDHVRIERIAFDGVLTPTSGLLRPDTSRPGLGLILKRSDLARFAA